MVSYCFSPNRNFFTIKTKWILSISLIVFGTFWLYPWSNHAEAIALERGISAYSDRLYTWHTRGVLIGTKVQILLLLIIETYRGTPEKQEIGSQVVLSGNFVVDKWRNSVLSVRGARSIGDNGSPRYIKNEAKA